MYLSSRSILLHNTLNCCMIKGIQQVNHSREKSSSATYSVFTIKPLLNHVPFAIDNYQLSLFGHFP